jgi:LmbE family N-acetylglucosaminyl deacetylase
MIRQIVRTLLFVFPLFFLLVFRHNPSSIGRELYPLLPMPPLSEMKRIMVIAPHPDDETLACGGLIALARREGIPVKVVVVTNGESFSYAAHIHYKKVVLPPSYYIKFGEKRQSETLSAMELLGVPKEDVIFLGYPDSGLCLLWEKYWDYNQLYSHTLLHTSFSPFQNIYRKNAPYCGRSLLEDLEKIILDYKPTHIFIPSAEDAHPTHWAVNSFANIALLELKERQKLSPQIHTYIVHRGHFPYPRGLKLEEMIKPPSTLLGLGFHWRSLPLQPDAVRLKYEAIKKYKSQLLPRMKIFMFSFARSNELFADEKDALPIHLVNKGRITVDGKGEDWTGIPPFLIDPQKDTLWKILEPQADITYVYACRDTDNLYLMLKTAKNISKKVRYYISIYGIEEINGKRLMLKKEFKPSVSEECLECAIPLYSLENNHSLFIGAMAKYKGVTIDKSAYRIAILEPHHLAHRMLLKRAHSH